MTSTGEPDDRAEWLEGRSRAPGSRELRWLALFVALVLVAAGVAVATYQRSAASLPPSSPSSSAPVSRPPQSAPTTPPAPTPSRSNSRIERIDVGGRLLGITAGYELVGIGSEGLVRVAPATGTVIRTSIPPMHSSGRLSLVAGDTFVILRPADAVMGYLVPDGASAQPLNGQLSKATQVLPTPSADRVWAVLSDQDQASTRATKIVAVNRNGRVTGATLPLPRDTAPYQVESDEAGHLMVAGLGGTYASGPGGLRRITTGMVLAVGRTRWLTKDCDDRAVCTINLVDRTNDRRRSLSKVDLGTAAYVGAGLISPDGRYASVPQYQGTGQVQTVVVDLETGRQWPIDVRLARNQPQVQVWAPDSRWLFLVGDDRLLRAVDPTTGRTQVISASIPRLDALTLRPAG